MGGERDVGALVLQFGAALHKQLALALKLNDNALGDGVFSSSA
jgi:hypothetical protein